MKTCKVIAVANQKGGVGKTTTTGALGVGLAREGNRVLLIDLDAQANLTMSLGYQNPDELPVTITDYLGMVIEDRDASTLNGILALPSGVSLIPSNIQLSGLETALVNTMSRESVFRACVQDLRPLYDYILIDCSPSLGMLTINALTASDSVLIPVQAHFFPAKGLELLLSTVRKVRRQMNPSLQVEGILLTMMDYRSTFVRDMAVTLRDTYGSIRVFQTEIPASVRAVETGAQGLAIYDYDPKGKVAQAYMALAKEMLALQRQEPMKRPTDRER